MDDVWLVNSSMVIRDLTLRSAASFGSFHLIRLLYDEYMFYIIEHKVAAAMQETSIAVMADYRQVRLATVSTPTFVFHASTVFPQPTKLTILLLFSCAVLSCENP